MWLIAFLQLCETPKQLAAGDKAIMELLENPGKALEVSKDLDIKFLIIDVIFVKGTTKMLCVGW